MLKGGVMVDHQATFAAAAAETTVCPTVLFVEKMFSDS